MARSTCILLAYKKTSPQQKNPFGLSWPGNETGSERPFSRLRGLEYIPTSDPADLILPTRRTRGRARLTTHALACRGGGGRRRWHGMTTTAKATATMIASPLTCPPRPSPLLTDFLVLRFLRFLPEVVEIRGTFV